MSETILRNLPRGIEPPQIISYNAANVPVAQLNIYSDTLSEQQLFDYGLNFIRIQLFTIPGFSSPAPLGGVQRAVMVNLDPTALYANGLSAYDVGNALAATNVVIPSGTAKMGDYEYNVDLNMSPSQGRRLQPAADQVPRTARRSFWAMLRRSPTPISRRPTWCASTASTAPTCWSSSTPPLRR